MKRRGVLLAVAAAAVGALAGPSPALAAAAPNLVANPAAADRDFVRWLSVRDPRAEVGSAALAKDDAGVPYDDGAAQVDQEARDFVEDLAYLDPSMTVRERAGYVTTDADVAEFLRYGWLSAARIDVDEFRAQYVADAGARWREARQATVTAVAVEQAARAGAADPVAAIRAWDTVRTRFARQPAGWAERERFARDRVDGWNRSAQTLGWSTSPLLGALVTEGSAVRSQWISEVTGAAEQSGWWNHLVQYAQAAANAWIYPDARATR